MPQLDGKPALGPGPHLPAETAAADRAVSAASPWAGNNFTLRFSHCLKHFTQLN